MANVRAGIRGPQVGMPVGMACSVVPPCEPSARRRQCLHLALWNAGAVLIKNGLEDSPLCNQEGCWADGWYGFPSDAN